MELQASLVPQTNPFFSKMALVSSNPHIFASLLGLCLRRILKKMKKIYIIDKLDLLQLDKLKENSKPIR